MTTSRWEKRKPILEFIDCDNVDEIPSATLLIIVTDITNTQC